jgi:hypothetical protein
MARSAGSRAIKGARYFVMGLMALCAGAPDAIAQNTLGGHFGVVFPLVTHVDGETVDIGDNFHMGFPRSPSTSRSCPAWISKRTNRSPCR